METNVEQKYTHIACADNVTSFYTCTPRVVESSNANL